MNEKQIFKIAADAYRQGKTQNDNPFNNDPFEKNWQPEEYDKYDQIIKGPGLKFYYTTDTEQKLADLCRMKDAEIKKLEEMVDRAIARINELNKRMEGER